MPARQKFASRLRARETLLGTFVKLRDPTVMEMLGALGFDFVILDAEHAAFGRENMAMAMIAARAAGLAALVRIPDADGHWIATALDCGAVGIMVPQVNSAAMAEKLAGKMRYGPEGRGFSPSTPGAAYGTRGIADHLARQPGETVLVCQIEDEGAVAEAQEIAAVDGVDALLVGPVDLAVSMGMTDTSNPDVMAKCRQAIAAARAAGAAAGMFLSDPKAARAWSEAGSNLFVLGTDQAFLMQAGRTILGDARTALKTGS